MSYLGSQVYDLKITRYKNRTKKLEVSGGGLTLFGEGYLLAIGDGTLYVVSRKGEEQALSIEPYPYQVPINSADFAAAVGTKVSRAYFRVADVLSQSIDDRLLISVAPHGFLRRKT